MCETLVDVRVDPRLKRGVGIVGKTSLREFNRDRSMCVIQISLRVCRQKVRANLLRPAMLRATRTRIASGQIIDESIRVEYRWSAVLHNLLGASP